MKTLLRGLATGMFLQMAVGPVFFYILSITLNSDIVASMAAVLGVVLADFIYIGVSILGIETLFEHEKMIFRTLGCRADSHEKRMIIKCRIIV